MHKLNKLNPVTTSDGATYCPAAAALKLRLTEDGTVPVIADGMSKAVMVKGDEDFVPIPYFRIENSKCTSRHPRTVRLRRKGIDQLLINGFIQNDFGKTVLELFEPPYESNPFRSD
ncbi:hypothetical protein [Ferrimonas balearica]|uniref:hypothetical protein n=1 Tax=Ferrimonas balearica TaxID=44012 RepID=UPI001F3260AE|nr:hypothetical protein [Ferrimonas balearica]MBY6093950.1 hypothetical protein [Ferrimonas balearica]